MLLSWLAVVGLLQAAEGHVLQTLAMHLFVLEVMANIGLIFFVWWCGLLARDVMVFVSYIPDSFGYLCLYYWKHRYVCSLLSGVCEHIGVPLQD